MDIKKPVTRPDNAYFSSGPCAKNPFFELNKLANAPLGRSHRAAVGKARLKLAIEETRNILEIPSDYRIAIVPASDTGAVEMAMWSILEGGYDLKALADSVKAHVTKLCEA